MKLIHAGYTNFWNMFKKFVLSSRRYSHERNAMRTGRNELEPPRIITRTSSNGQFVPVRAEIRHSGTGALASLSASLSACCWVLHPQKSIRWVTQFLQSWKPCCTGNIECCFHESGANLLPVTICTFSMHDILQHRPVVSMITVFLWFCRISDVWLLA